MNPLQDKATDAADECYKITCKNYPSDFILDKNLAKEYFRQFGKLKRLTFKPKLRICTVEYTNSDGYLNALNNAGEYNGTIFRVSSETSPVRKKKIKSAKHIWVDNDEIEAELAAMAAVAPKSNIFGNISQVPSSESITEGKVEKSQKLKRSWALETPPKVKKKSKTKEMALQKSERLSSGGAFSKDMELINVVKSQALTIEEKFRVLDARDKLIRIKLKARATLKSSPTAGSCPDMCPEKERLMRETQHQVALYEQDNDRSMNQSKAIKQYSRSSADQEMPLPHELRPVSVLQMTMAYLMHNIIDLCETNDVNLAEWYHFLWDRTRGIRKDITQQELCSQGAVELIEQCARFHIHCSARLVAEDPSVFDQKINTENLTKCLQSLKYMYHDLHLKGERCPHEAEFRAYIILLNLNDGNFMWEVQELNTEIQKSKEVKFALEVYSALDKNNYVKFFKLVYSTTYLNACVLMRYFIQVRVTALKTLLKCYTSRAFRSLYPLDELKQLLAFDDIESTVEFVQAYGLSTSEEGARIVLEKNTFFIPELPYVLDRSLNVVESKRTCSVGRIVCGKDLPARMFDMHVPENSFDRNGYLIFQDLLDESDLDQSEEIVNIEPSPVKSIENVASLFAQKEVVVRPLERSIFAQAEEQKADVGMFTSPNVFLRPTESQKSIFSNEASIFGTHIVPKVQEMGTFSKDEPDSIPPNVQNIFTKNLQDVPMFEVPKVPFGQVPLPIEAPKSISASSQSKRGGFYFELPKTKLEVTVSSTFGTLSQSIAPTPETIVSEASSLAEEEELKEFKRKLEEKERENELRKKEQEEEERQRKREVLKREQEQLKRIKKQKKEEELRKRLEELRKEEKRQEQEIRDVVTLVLETVVERVDNKISRERLAEISAKIQRRNTLSVFSKWRQIVQRNKRKRKAMDCSPAWINTKTLEQSAEELHTTSQELTLKLRKRYKYGRALDIEPIEEEKVEKVDLFQLTYATLNRRFFDLKGTLQKNIFWKVEISLPDHYELPNGLNRIEDTLKDAFGWEDRNGTVMLLEQHQPNGMESVTYCVERQRGLYVRYGDANGIIFIAKDFNSLLQRRILENLKDLGVFTKIPIVIILQEYNESECNLRALIDENIVSDYIILVQNLMPHTLIGLVEEGLVYLAGKVEKPPPLMLDTLSAFLRKYLCTEIWKRANSFAKWNSYYKSCLRNPNTVIGLYNEALAQLKKIALNKSCLEYPSFPEVFKGYLQSEIPDYLPCNYCYFPKFWKSNDYVSKQVKIMRRFTLPKWLDKWPPSNELGLEVNLSKYCTRVFAEPEKPFYKIMSVVLQDVDPNVNFEDVNKVLWTDIIEVLALEKLNEANLSLSGTAFETKSIFNQFVVVYDVDTLENYSKSDWFYIGHPMIKKQVERLMKYENLEERRHKEKCELSSELDLDATIEKVTNRLKNKRDNSHLKKELAEFNVMLSDLESSMNVLKKISSTMEDNLTKAIADN